MRDRRLKPALTPGDTFVTKLKSKRIVPKGFRGFFQYQNRRYWCRVVSWHEETYKDGWNRRRKRRVLNLIVVEA